MFDFFLFALSIIIIVFSIVFARFRIVLALTAGVLLGACRASQIIRDQKIATSFIGREVILTATVAEWPEYKNDQTRLQLKELRFNYSTSVLNCQIYASLAGKNDDIERSDRVTFRAKLKGGFGDYVAYVRNPTILSISKPDPPDFFAKIRTLFTERVRLALGNSDSTGLTLGFLIGERTLTEDFKNRLRVVGLSHIVVASGFCLSILAEFAQRRMKNVSRFASYLSAAVLMIIFIMIAGVSPSLLRASLVSGMSLLAGYYGRKFHPGRLLLYAVAISVLINPVIIKSLA